jgi:CheY-like chemotaxis protein
MLLVDRDTQVRKTLTRMLQEHDAVVVHAQNAHWAMLEYGRQTFDAVLTEYQLTDMKGDELAGAIKASNPNQRVILLTGDVERVLVEGRPPVSADVVLPTPCKIAQLGFALQCPAPAAPVLQAQ